MGKLTEYIIYLCLKKGDISPVLIKIKLTLGLAQNKVRLAFKTSYVETGNG